MKYSVIIPVYKNEESISRLLDVLTDMNSKLHGNMEAVFVVDGSPDKSYEMILQRLESLDFSAQLIAHSRNFGSFSAIRTGLSVAKGSYFGVMAADLQEPPELLLEFFNILKDDGHDVVIGTRSSRADTLSSKISSGIFWGIYRRLVVKDMPSGGVDIFGCNNIFRKELLRLDESRSSLIALIFWLGFRRKLVSYERLERLEGASSWTFRKKVDYMMDSIFAFTDFPIRMLTNIGAIGSVLAFVFAIVVLTARLMGLIEVSGYATTIIVILSFGTLNLFGLGLVGTYAWRAYENSKGRPLSIIISKKTNR
ncbi:glycosyltransferase family 2 protein [Psychromonas aquimarina]|uniref:glycosyltransferase family 2 protein n=1 Tax=Psychromonas aquimarina TaxID=444919 RepID=UPI0004104D69|nr:glycosyltransferase family 2 protein [Psychromonas aquimarina]